jgi:hypothetical protein
VYLYIIIKNKMVMSLEQIKCTRCKNDMPKLRLDNYGYDFCVSCSDVKPKVGRIRVVGEGDYTATELDVVDQDTARRLQEMENVSRGVRNVPLEILNFDEDELSDDSRAILEATEKALEGELEVEEEDGDILGDLDDAVDAEGLELEDEDDE